METQIEDMISAAALAAGVETVAQQLDAPMAASRISSALIGCKGVSWAERLQDALIQLEVDSNIELMDADGALAAAHEDDLVVTRDGREWLMLSGTHGRKKARAIWTSEQGSQRATWVDTDDLEETLGDRACWLRVRRGLPMSELSGVAKGEDHAKRAFAQVKALIAMERPLLRAIIAYAVLVGMLEVITPIAVQALVNTIAFNVVLQPLIFLSIVLFVALCFLGTLRVAEHWVVELLQRRLFIRLVTDLAERLPRVTLETHKTRDVQELLNRVFDIVTIQKASATLLLDTLSIALQLVIGMIVLAFYHPYLLAFDLVLAFCVVVVVFFMGRNAVHTSLDESDAKYKVAAWLEEVSTDPSRFSSRRGARAAATRAEALALHWLNKRTSHFRIVLRQVIGAAALHALASVGLLAIGGYLVIKGQLTLGQLVAAELIVTAVAASIAKLGKHLETYYDLAASTYKVSKLLDLELEPSAGEVLDRELDRLGVRLVTGQGSELVIEPGESVGITGSDAESASMLLDALYGMRPRGKWEAFINEMDVDGLSAPSLREQVVLVRDAQAFEGTVEENIMLEAPLEGALMAREALDAVGLLDELVRDARGQRTQLTGTGAPLTNEQLKRMAIARALAANPTLILVDRALDYVTTAKMPVVLDALFETHSDATILTVSEHPGVLSRCDRVVRLERGLFSTIRDDRRQTDGQR